MKNHRHSQKDLFPFQIQYTSRWFAIEAIHLHFLQEESQMLTKGFVLSTKASILPANCWSNNCTLLHESVFRVVCCTIMTFVSKLKIFMR